MSQLANHVYGTRDHGAVVVVKSRLQLLKSDAKALGKLNVDFVHRDNSLLADVGLWVRHQLQHVADAVSPQVSGGDVAQAIQRQPDAVKAVQVVDELLFEQVGGQEDKICAFIKRLSR